MKVLSNNEITPVFKDFFLSYVNFMNDFINETDRAAVIVGTAKVDYLLSKILENYLIPVTSNDDLLENDSPLSTFSARIKISYRLGLIDIQFARTLNMLRKIRNDFAHNISECKLDSAPHRDKIRDFIRPYIHTAWFESGLKMISDNTKTSKEFYALVGLMIIKLEFMLASTKTIEISKDASLIDIVSI